MCIPRTKSEQFTDEEIRSQIRDIYAMCFTDTGINGNKRTRWAKALRGMILILRNSTRNQLQKVGPREIVFSAVKMLFNFENAVKKWDANCNWKRRRDYKIARECYHDILRSFIPEESRKLVYSLVEIVHRERLWHWQDLCWEIGLGLLEYGVNGGPIVDALLDQVEAKENPDEDARAIVRILYEMLDVYFWPNTSDTVLAIERILKLYYGSLCGATAKSVPPYAPLRKGLEVCIRHMIKHLVNEQLLVIIYHMCAWSINDNTTDNTILDFGSTLEYAAYMHESRLYKDTLVDKIFSILMRMISSTSRLVSLLGNRVFQYLLDRRNNRSTFDTPKIFFESMEFDMKVNECNKEDKHFFQKHREILHESLVKSMINHCSTRLNLESTYCTICLIAVEVPCGFIAAALVCLAMNLQDLILEQSEINREFSYHIHATVIAIMSLLCWIHDAKVFYSYVNKIMMERAQWAPHLNPPLKARYSSAVHHVLWDKPELFFVDWEARYGLWKCFRLRESQQQNSNENVKKVKL